jgi:hypothetical protein
MRGILSSCAVLHTADGKVVALPAGSQVDITSDDDWYQDVQDADINEALDLLEEA